MRRREDGVGTQPTAAAGVTLDAMMKVPGESEPRWVQVVVPPEQIEALRREGEKTSTKRRRVSDIALGGKVGSKAGKAVGHPHGGSHTRSSSLGSRPAPREPILTPQQSQGPARARAFTPPPHKPSVLRSHSPRLFTGEGPPQNPTPYPVSRTSLLSNHANPPSAPPSSGLIGFRPTTFPQGPRLATAQRAAERQAAHVVKARTAQQEPQRKGSGARRPGRAASTGNLVPQIPTIPTQQPPIPSMAEEDQLGSARGPNTQSSTVSTVSSSSSMNQTRTRDTSPERPMEKAATYTAATLPPDDLPTPRLTSALRNPHKSRTTKGQERHASIIAPTDNYPFPLHPPQNADASFEEDASFSVDDAEQNDQMAPQPPPQPRPKRRRRTSNQPQNPNPGGASPAPTPPNANGISRTGGAYTLSHSSQSMMPASSSLNRSTAPSMGQGIPHFSFPVPNSTQSIAMQWGGVQGGFIIRGSNGTQPAPAQQQMGVSGGLPGSSVSRSLSAPWSLYSTQPQAARTADS